MLGHRLFYFLRHGETDWNAQGRCQGQTDIPLNDFGRWQASCAARHLKTHPITAIITSPLSRARETAEIISRDRSLPIIILPELQEMNLGEDEGAIKGPWLEQWRSGQYLPRDAESYLDFITRCQMGLWKATNGAEHALIVSHGGVFWAIEQMTGKKLGRTLNNGEAITIDPPTTNHPRWRFTSLPSIQPAAPLSSRPAPIAIHPAEQSAE